MNDIILGNKTIITSNRALISIVCTSGSNDFSACRDDVSALENHGEHGPCGRPLYNPFEEIFTLMLLVMFFKLLLPRLA